jgi:hypothetical protein
VLPADLSAGAAVPPPSAEQRAKAEAERKARQERIAEIRQNITYLNQCLSREQEELARTTDARRKGSYEFRILGLRSDVQAEEDLVKSLETGEYVHTRSPFDDYAHANFVQQCQAEAREASQTLRGADAANRLAAMLPPDEAARAREFISRQLTPKVLGRHDVATTRKVVQALHEQVQGHWQGEAAKGQAQAAVADFGVEAAQNIKSAADTGMSVCSLFGGQSINLIYQAGTGYAEGGPVQALKAAATTWSDAADYAVTAYESYQEGGAGGMTTTLLAKYAQDKTLGYLAGKFMGSAGGGAEGPSRKPTLQEQFDAAKFRQEREWGEALVKDFDRTQQALTKAGQSGAAAEAIQQLQAAARDKAAAVASSLHAKNFLKYRAEARLGSAYDAHMRAVHAEADALLKGSMKEAKWNADDWDLREFRNAASFGKPNMDRDVGLRERSLWEVDASGRPVLGSDGRPVRNPDAWSAAPNGQPVPKPQLTKEGKPMTLDEWREEAQKLYNRAYRKASGGRSAEIAMEGITTSSHPEAYKDLLWLGDDKNLVAQAWAAQAGDVTRYKAAHLLQKGDPSAAYFTKLQEVSRGTAKDLETKVLPLLKSAKPAGGDVLRGGRGVSSEALQMAQAHWAEVHKVLQGFGRNDIDPITATRRVRELTGGKSIPEVVDEMATLMESLVKGRRR